MEIASEIVRILQLGATGVVVGTENIWRVQLPDQQRYEDGAVLVLGFQTREEAKQKTLLKVHNLTVTAYHVHVDELDDIVEAIKSDLIDLEGLINDARTIKKTRMSLQTAPFFEDTKNVFAVSMEFITMEP